MHLDKVDEAIVWRLAEDGRQSIAQLAASIGIAASTCHARVQALRAEGVIQSFHAQVNLEAVGFPFQALVMVRLRPQRRAELEAYRERIIRLPQVLNLFITASVENCVIHVACASRTQLRDFVSTHVNSDPAVISTQTNLIFDHYLGSEFMSHLSGFDEMRHDIR